MNGYSRHVERGQIGGPLLDPVNGRVLRELARRASEQISPEIWFTIYECAQPMTRIRRTPPPWGPVFDAAEMFVDILTDTPAATRRHTYEHFADIGRSEADLGHDLDDVQRALAIAQAIAEVVLADGISALRLSDDDAFMLQVAAFDYFDVLREAVVQGFTERLELWAMEDVVGYDSLLRRQLIFGDDDWPSPFVARGLPYPERITLVVTSSRALRGISTEAKTLGGSRISRNRGLFILLADPVVAHDQAQQIADLSSAPVVVGWPVPPPDVARAHRQVVATFREAEFRIGGRGVLHCDADQRLT